MLSIAKRTTVGAALLLVMPLAAWISGWHWQPEEESRWLKVLFWVTETVTQPWGIITHTLLCGWFLWCLRFRFKSGGDAVCDSGGGYFDRARGKILDQR